MNENITAVMGLIRHALTTGGGYLAGAGIVAKDDVSTLVAGAMVVVGIVWSFLQKKGTVKA